ncbi:Serine/threonine protein kinase [Conoideocrella luteorostrata]|uniref:Serine/threonine protein kinase n=1 Tax=Conoideocrella luteorostrata TaxID=1105319 RepID=A0AAJ0CSC2_9HYPO|nr:Serine/threonine protein kinase [Conoideocrella luteorostrata]
MDWNDIDKLVSLCDQSFQRIKSDQEPTIDKFVDDQHQRFRRWSSRMGIFAKDPPRLDTFRRTVLKLLWITQAYLEPVIPFHLREPSDASPRDRQVFVELEQYRKHAPPLIGYLHRVEWAIDCLLGLEVAIRKWSAKTLAKRIVDFQAGEDDQIFADMVYARLKGKFDDEVDCSLPEEAAPGSEFCDANSLWKRLAASVSHQYFNLRFYQLPRSTQLYELACFSPDSATAKMFTVPNSHPTRTNFADPALPEYFNVPGPPEIISAEQGARCQYCLQWFHEDKYSEKGWWQKHIYADIKPFACIYEECRNIPQSFASFEDWRTHMDTHDPNGTRLDHTHLRWHYKQESSHFKQASNNEHQYDEHVKTCQPEFSSGSDLEDMKSLHNMRMHRGKFTCPLCNDAPKNLRSAASKGSQLSDVEEQDYRNELLKHIAGHLEMIGFWVVEYLDYENRENSGEKVNRVNKENTVNKGNRVEGSRVNKEDRVKGNRVNKEDKVKGNRVNKEDRVKGNRVNKENKDSKDIKDNMNNRYNKNYKYDEDSEDNEDNKDLEMSVSNFIVEKILRQGLQNEKQRNSPLDVLSYLHCLGECLLKNNGLDLAELIFVERHKNCVEYFGEAHTNTTEDLDTVISILSLLGKVNEAGRRRLYYQQLVAAHKSIPPSTEYSFQILSSNDHAEVEYVDTPETSEEKKG